MEDQSRLTWHAAPGGILAGAARMAVGLGCVAVQAPRPGIELLVTNLQDALFVAPDDDALFGKPPGISAIIFDDSLDDDSSIVIQHLRSLVDNLSMPESWRIEGVEEPTQDCMIYAGTVLRRLFESFGLIPYKTSISKDGGILAAYRSSHGRNILRVEVDNELDAVAVVTDGVAILNSGLLEGDDTERSIIDSFNRDLA
jgi:hypothetical protein